MTYDEFKALRDEILRDSPEAWEAVKHKARWEQITLLAVLNEYGDPREWGRAYLRRLPREEEGGATQAELGEEYGVVQQHIGLIVNDKIWRCS